MFSSFRAILESFWKKKKRRSEKNEQKKTKKNTKGPSSLPGGSQVDDLPPAAIIRMQGNWRPGQLRTYPEKLASFFEKRIVF